MTTFPGTSALKAQARRLRAALDTQGNPVSHSAALELVAQSHGLRDWNTAAALATDAPVTAPWQVGQRVRGHYLGQPFAGSVIAVAARGSRFHRLTIEFDKAVDIVRSAHFSSLRRRVSATVTAEGRTVEHTSDGEPHLRLAI